VTSEISTSLKEVAESGAVTAGSMPAADSVAVAAKDSPATPKPAAPKTDKAFLDRFPLEGCFIRDIYCPFHPYDENSQVQEHQCSKHCCIALELKSNYSTAIRRERCSQRTNLIWRSNFLLTNKFIQE
jgi:hypothetical protein